ncbi:MAG: DNA-binding protein SMUBP-2-like [Gemmataceae bacterium]|nr:DNA-binding protein SMUBP-2-like [Gemmataceae bacterium]
MSTPSDLEPIARGWSPLPLRPLAELSPNQEEAVRAAVFGPDMTLVHGPPGCGKTTVVLEILRQLFYLHREDPGFKVLLVAPPHVAVDNVLERLAAPRPGGTVVTDLGVVPYRVGSTRRIAEHLRGFTPDCVNAGYHQQLEREVAAYADRARVERDLDQAMIELLADGARRDHAAWTRAAPGGPIPEPEGGRPGRPLSVRTGRRGSRRRPAGYGPGGTGAPGAPARTNGRVCSGGGSRSSGLTPGSSRPSW